MFGIRCLECLPIAPWPFPVSVRNCIESFDERSMALSIRSFGTWSGVVNVDPGRNRLYDDLVELMPSPVVELNRAMAIAMAFGPAAGIET